VAHAVQLFDSDDSMATHVAAFLHRGYLSGERIRVVATTDHMAAIAHQLNTLGCPVERLTATRDLVWWDAATTLHTLMGDGRVDPARLRPLARELSAADGRARPTRVFGEMVDVLAERGNLKASIALEDAWTRALTGVPADVLCGYHSTRFSDPATRCALTAICKAHDAVHDTPGDDLANWLLNR
jgi:hypothetical protein